MQGVITRGIAAITTPSEAVAAMLEAGAVFTVARRTDCLETSFTYRVAPGGDAERARAILVGVKARPAQFFEAFKVAVAALPKPAQALEEGRE